MSTYILGNDIHVSVRYPQLFQNQLAVSIVMKNSAKIKC